jgi:hypothetical protein
MDNAAPKAAPEARPRISGLTRGFLNTPWNAAPDTERAAPTSIVIQIRGSLILNITDSYMTG